MSQKYAPVVIFVKVDFYISKCSSILLGSQNGSCEFSHDHLKVKVKVIRKIQIFSALRRHRQPLASQLYLK